MLCTEPFPKVFSPRMMARCRSCKQPVTISDALALPILTSTTMGMPVQFVAAAIGAPDGILRRIAAFGGNNQLPARQEFLANVHRLIEQTAGIPA